MSQSYYWSKSTLGFYPAALKPVYEASGSFPSDAILVDDALFTTYGSTSPVSGKTRGVDANGLPTWVDAT